jgi:hypothetical protein
MAFAHIQGGRNATNGSTQATLSVTLGATVGVGNHICGHFAGVLGVSGSILSIADDKGNNYTIVDTQLAPSDNLLSASSFYLLNIINSPITITVTLASATSYLNLLIDEFSGPIAGLDAHSINSQASVATTSNAVTSGSVTAATAGSLVFGGTENQGGVGATTGTGFTAGQSDATAGDDFAYTEYILSRGAGAVAATFTAGGVENYQTTIMVFSPPAPVLLYGQIWM